LPKLSFFILNRNYRECLQMAHLRLSANGSNERKTDTQKIIW
jgi:hypothetical protein